MLSEAGCPAQPALVRRRNRATGMHRWVADPPAPRDRTRFYVRLMVPSHVPTRVCFNSSSPNQWLVTALVSV
jgi:hypothetical protein